MAGPSPLNYPMQPHLDGKRVQVPPPARGFEPHIPGNKFETPPGNRSQPLPSESVPLPSASSCENQHVPPSSLLQLPLPSDVLRQPPDKRVLQYSTPQNMFQQPPCSNTQRPPPISAHLPSSINMHHPPPRNMFQQPPPSNMRQPPPSNMRQPPPSNMRQPPPTNMRQPPSIAVQLPPLRNMFQSSAISMRQPPPINMSQPPPINMRQPPPINMRQPPPINMRQPPPVNMCQPPPINMCQPPPTNMRQPPPTNIQKHSGNMLQQPHPRSTMKPPGMSEPPPGILYPPPCTLTSSQPSLELPAPQVSAIPCAPLGVTAPQFGNVQFHPPRPTLHRGKCVPNSSETPAAFLSERRVPIIFADRPPPVCKPFPAGGISSDLATSEVFPSSLLFRKSGEITGSENTMSELSHPFINTSSFGLPSPLATTNIDCSVSAANVCAISPFVSMPPPIPSLHEGLLSSSVDAKPAHNLAESLSAIEIPRHPLNNNWISITKLQSNVDEWLSKKLNSESHDASLDRGDASNKCGHNSPEAQNSVLSYQELEELKKILQESDFHDNEKELLSSTLSLLCKQYRDLRLRDVHTCVAAYTLLLQRLRGGLGVVPTAAVRKLLDRIKCILSDQKFKELLKKLVTARTKKRQRKKKRKQFLKHEWDRKGKLIDARREQLQSLEQEKVQESKLRAEADAVLKEVRGKQEEAEALQSLLWTLRDLRQHRLNRGEQQGYVSSQRDDDCFNRVTDGLEKMIETQLSDYALEERTLQAMLQSCHPPAATSQSETADWDTVPSAVTEALFGAPSPGDDALYASYCAADTSLEMLVARRRAWDGHIVHHNADDNSLASSAPCDGASGVPVCWVLPPCAPTPAWRQYLANSK